MLYYGFAQWTVKWWKRVFFHLLDLSIVNAHILYNATADKMTQLEFRIAVAKGLLQDFCVSHPWTKCSYCWSFMVHEGGIPWANTQPRPARLQSVQ